jgi:hypothetical protein
VMRARPAAERYPCACRLLQYGKYVDSLEDAEAAPGCESCAENRRILEQAWQVVANEYFDPKGRFSQTWWAGELEKALRSTGGAHPALLRTDIGTAQHGPALLASPVRGSMCGSMRSSMRGSMCSSVAWHSTALHGTPQHSTALPL